MTIKTLMCEALKYLWKIQPGGEQLYDLLLLGPARQTQVKQQVDLIPGKLDLFSFLGGLGLTWPPRGPFGGAAAADQWRPSCTPPAICTAGIVARVPPFLAFNSETDISS